MRLPEAATQQSECANWTLPCANSVVHPTYSLLSTEEARPADASAAHTQGERSAAAGTATRPGYRAERTAAKNDSRTRRHRRAKKKRQRRRWRTRSNYRLNGETRWGDERAAIGRLHMSGSGEFWGGAGTGVEMTKLKRTTNDHPGELRREDGCYNRIQSEGERKLVETTVITEKDGR